MASNRLQLNSDKTECLWLRARKFDHLYFPDLCAGHAIIKPAKHARNLGFYFDEHLEFQPQINNLSKGCFYQLRQIRSIAKHLDSDVIKSILQAFVASRLDYCNVLYGHLPAYRIQQIQRIQNAAARIFCYRHDHHITHVLRDNLHWLPIRWRIIYKVAVITYKTLRGMSADYLTDLCPVVSDNSTYSAYNLRSVVHRNIAVNRVNTCCYGDRTFQKQSASVWNDLPPSLRASSTITTFCAGLKTLLFRLAYY